MPKILLIGNSGTKANSSNGQVAKIRLYKELIEKENCSYIFVDLENFFRNSIKILHQIKVGIKECDRIVLLTAHKGWRILVPYINHINKRYKKPLIFPMIGINILHKYVDKLDSDQHYQFMHELNFGKLHPSKRDVKQLSKITYILPENEAVRKVLNAFFNLDNIKILNNFRYVENNTAKILNNESKEPLKLVFLSRVNKEKGIFQLLEAVNELNFNSTVVTLDIFGDKQFDDASGTLFNSMLNSNIRYKGTIPNSKVITTLSTYDIFVFPTQYKSEGTPGVLAESLIAGTPVISSNFPQVDSLLEKNKNSLIYPASSKEELKKCIMLLNDRNTLKTFSEAAAKSGYKYTYSANRIDFLKYVLGIEKYN